jgi:hypothetical protein
VPWANTISIKHRFYQEGSKRKCELQAIPDGKIRYTTDGSSAETHGTPYEKPFDVPKDCQVIVAVAEERGVKSIPVTITAPKGKVDVGTTIDRNKAAVWKRGFKRDSTVKAQVLGNRKNMAAELGSVRLTIMRIPVDRTGTPEDITYPHFERERTPEGIHPDGNPSVDIGSLKFDSGQQLLDMVRTATSARKGSAPVIAIRNAIHRFWF